MRHVALTAPTIVGGDGRRTSSRARRCGSVLAVVLLVCFSGCATIVRSSVPDVATGQSDANGRSWAPAVSGDGRYTVFLSDASNLVAGDTNGVTDVFVRDNSKQSVVRLTNGAVDANSHPAISVDGSRVAYTVIQPGKDSSPTCRLAVVALATQVSITTSGR